MSFIEKVLSLSQKKAESDNAACRRTTFGLARGAEPAEKYAADFAALLERLGKTTADVERDVQVVRNYDAAAEQAKAHEVARQQLDAAIAAQREFKTSKWDPIDAELRRLGDAIATANASVGITAQAASRCAAIKGAHPELFTE